MEICNIRGLNGTISPPPPLNATNLLDISHALEAVNITQQQRTSLSAESNATLGNILQLINDKIEQLNTTVNKKGSANIEVGSYVGTGTSGVNHKCTLNFSFAPKTVFISTQNVNSRAPTTFSFIYDNKTCFAVSGSSELSSYNLDVVWNGNSMSWSRTGSGTISEPVLQLNESGKKYFYVAIG